MRKLFRAICIGAGNLYSRMAVEFFMDWMIVIAVMALLVSAWYFFGMRIARKVR